MIKNVFSLRTDKKTLLKETGFVNEKKFSKAINTIMAESRGLTYEEVKHERFITHFEVLKFYASIGEDIRNYSQEMKQKKTA